MKKIAADFLKKLKPLSDLPMSECQALLEHVQYRELLAGERVFSHDCRLHLAYLIEGRVALNEQLTANIFIKEEDERALSPIFEEGSSEVHIEAQSLSTILFIDKEMLERIIYDEVFVSYENNIELTDVELVLYHEILQAIENGHLILPSLPEIALRVKAAIAQEHVNADDVEHIIEADPVMTVRLIQVANSALVRGIEPVESVRDAIVRLGLSMTQNLVLSLSVKQLFRSDEPLLRRYMNKLYQHSIEISAISFSLASREKGMNADQLLLAGLVHDIGVIPILAYIEKSGLEIDPKNEKEVGHIIAKLRAAIGVLIIKHWGFPESMIDVVEYAECWSYEASDTISMCDIVNMAHIFSLLKNKQIELMPDMENVAAFKKMFAQRQLMDVSNEVLEQAKEKIVEVKRLLRL